MNNRIKLDTTVLQSNTSMHLVQYMIEQRNVIVRYYNNEKVSLTQMKELQEDFEYIMKKHADALHKRCGTNIYPKANGYKGGLNVEKNGTTIQFSTKELYPEKKEDKDADTL